MIALKGGPVPVPRWILAFRALQLLFAFTIIGLIAFSLSVEGGGERQHALIPTMVIAFLTVIPIFVVTTPLHVVQRQLYDPRIALAADGVACLFWLAAFTALGSYQRIFYYNDEYNEYSEYSKRAVESAFGLLKFGVGRIAIRDEDNERTGQAEADGYDQEDFVRSWKTGAAGAWLGGVEFFLYLCTTLLFLYYYHLHLVKLSGSGGGAASSTAMEDAFAVEKDTDLERGEPTESPIVAPAPRHPSGLNAAGEATLEEQIASALEASKGDGAKKDVGPATPEDEEEKEHESKEEEIPATAPTHHTTADSRPL